MLSKRSKSDFLSISDLSQVDVRPIHPPEREQWDRLMSSYHYLGYHGFVGESLKYVATIDGEWVALLGWAAASLKNGHRDRWIGWTQEIQYRRLKYIANNVRFLILPWVRMKNLASKVLSLNLKRLSSDWEANYGHPIVLVETFIDHQRFSGTCYRAAGWIELGQTRGYGRKGGKYYHHGEAKTIFVRPTRPDARILLSSPFLSNELIGTGAEQMMDINRIERKRLKDLRNRLRCITDPRKSRGIRHNHDFILLVAICAILSGCRGYTAIGEWVRNLPVEMLKRLGCRYNLNRGGYIPPSEPTIRRTLQNVDPEQVDRVLGEWLAEQTDSDAIAVDGKRLRGASLSGGKSVHLLAALVHHEGTVIAQKQVDDGSNEITTFTDLLDEVDVKGKVVTADAMHTQVDNALYLKKRKGDYLFEVKENQPTLVKEIKNIFSKKVFIGESETVEKGHGRIEIRRIQTHGLRPLERHLLAFPYCFQVFRIERITTIIKSDKTREEIAYYVTSLPQHKASPERLLGLARGHWHIENKLHWTRDVTFDEDRSQVRTKSGPRVMAALRNFVISLFRLCGFQNIAAALRCLSWDPSRSLFLLGVY